MRYLYALILLILPVCAFSQSCDLLIKNGKIIDGTGNSWYYGDIAISENKIIAIGELNNYTSTHTIDAKKQVIAPGFIDVHTHIEGDEKRTPTADNFIYDGVTTVITGNCGSSNINLKEYFNTIDSLKLSVNVASFIGHNDIRNAVMKMANRAPTPTELTDMKNIVKQAMEDGAVGFSTGLIYIPGTYAKTSEVLALAKVAAKYNGIYTSHIRSEGAEIFAALKEALHIGKAANMPVEISHFKIGKPNLGRSNETLAMVKKARNDGYDVTIDQYPYTASSTTITALIPSWALEGGRDSLKLKLQDSILRKRIISKMIASAKKKQISDFSYAVVASCRFHPQYNGKSITEINKILDQPPGLEHEVEIILDLASQESVGMIFHGMDEADVENILKYPYTMVGSDSGIREYGAGMPHPRGYGTNARILGMYVREKNSITLEDAIRRMTSLPAQKFGFTNRGLIKEGMVADIVIFDPETVIDQATYQDPHHYSKGFQYVIVNGKLTVDNFKHNGTRNGVVLHRLGYH